MPEEILLTPTIPVGASLLAKRPSHSAFALADTPPSRASSLPQLSGCDGTASGRKAASGGNRLPLFWHCRLACLAQSPGIRGFSYLARRLLKLRYEKPVT
ncbi:hypothetical protein BSZ28_10080 [Pseudomonas moraviensis]|nr:hypothetical protein BSZ28_10080 [Pseudomonas moraviensis]